MTAQGTGLRFSIASMALLGCLNLQGYQGGLSLFCLYPLGHSALFESEVPAWHACR